MALSISNKSTQKEQLLNNVFEDLKDFLSNNLNSVNKSHIYFKCGLDDELVNYLNEHINNPLTIISHSFDTHFDSVGKLLEVITSKFFYDNKQVINSVYRSNEKGNFLHYFIVLKKDTLKNRRNFFAFLREYEKENLSKKFPIDFDFISSRRAKSIRIAKKIALDDEKSSAKSTV